MSYKQAMKWARKHPKGTRQPVIMSTNSGLWLSGAFIDEDYAPYKEACIKAGLEPIPANDFYRIVVGMKYQRTADGYVAMQKAGNLK